MKIDEKYSKNTVYKEEHRNKTQKYFKFFKIRVDKQ